MHVVPGSNLLSHINVSPVSKELSLISTALIRKIREYTVIQQGNYHSELCQLIYQTFVMLRQVS